MIHNAGIAVLFLFLLVGRRCTPAAEKGGSGQAITLCGQTTLSGSTPDKA